MEDKKLVNAPSDLKDRTRGGAAKRKSFKDMPELDQTQLLVIVIYLLVMLFVMAGIPFIFKFYKASENIDLLLTMVFYTAASGGVGGTIYCMRAFVQHLVMKDFDLNYVVWYMFSPLISAMLGAISFFILFGGLMALSGNNSEAPSSLGDLNVKAFYIAVAFLAGFSVGPFWKKLRLLSKSIFTEAEDDLDEKKNDGKERPITQASANGTLTTEGNKTK